MKTIEINIFFKAGVFILFALLVLQSCDDGDRDDEKLKKEEKVPSLVITTDTLNFSFESSSLDLEISSSMEWNVSVNETWCKIPDFIEKVNPSGKRIILSVEVDKNPLMQERKAIISISDVEGISKTVTVIQSAKDEPDPNFKSFKFISETNYGKLDEDVICEVEDSMIFATSSFVIEEMVLIPEFEFDGWKVFLNEKEVISGQTAIDFSNSVTLLIKNRNGEQKEYTIKIISFTGLPVIYINTNDVPIDSKENYVSATIKVVDNNGLRESTIFESDVDIRGRGNSTWKMPKKPYRLKFNKKTSLFGEPAEKSWVLLANYMDDACGIRNAAALSIGHLSDLEFTATTHFVEVFLNGSYNGTYQLCEHMQISENRVNVTDNGYLLEADQYSRLDSGDVYFRTERILINIKDPDVEMGSAKFNWIKDYVNEVENVLYSDDFADPETGYTKYLDIDSYVDWYVISEITKTNDAALYSSCFMNIAPEGKLKMGPIWDYDISLGNIEWNDKKIRGPEGYWNMDSPWFEQMLLDPVFVEKVKARIQYFKSNLSFILSKIDNNARYINMSVVENNRLWENLKHSDTPDAKVHKAFEKEVDNVKKWLTARLEWLEQASFQ